jgi:hypothetical protein
MFFEGGAMFLVAKFRAPKGRIRRPLGFFFFFCPYAFRGGCSVFGCEISRAQGTDLPAAGLFFVGGATFLVARFRMPGGRIHWPLGSKKENKRKQKIQQQENKV